MLGDLIAKLDRPDVAAVVLRTLDPVLAAQIERRAASEAMAVADFAAGAVRDFVERADDELWLQLLTVMRNAENPGLAAIQSILRWVAAGEEPPPDAYIANAPATDGGSPQVPLSLN